MASTLFLNPNTWDLAIDTNGNIAVATSTYQKAQDIASNVRVFYADKYYDQTAGVPYLQKILGKTGSYPLSLFRQKALEMASNVDNVDNVQIEFNTLKDRVLSGTITFTDTELNTTGTISI